MYVCIKRGSPERFILLRNATINRWSIYQVHQCSVCTRGEESPWHQAVFFFCVDPFCWTRKHTIKTQSSAMHCIRRYLWHMQCVARCCWPKMNVYFTYNVSIQCFFADDILMIFWWYSDDILMIFVSKIIYISAYAPTLICTYMNYRTRLLMVSRMCIYTPQDNATHVFVRFRHGKNQLYIWEIF